MTDPTNDRAARSREGRRRVLLTLQDENVAPRFDLATEVLVAELEPDGTVRSQRTVVLPEASAEALCHLVVADGIDELICGAIEEEYHQYLTWKKVRIIDSVVARWEDALARHRSNELAEGDVLFAPDGDPDGTE